jgi:hypothetical protein
MALKIMNKQFMGIQVPETYAKIGNINGNQTELRCTLSYYAMNNGVLSDLSYDSYNFSIVPSVADGADNFIKQGYSYLKTLPEFSGATDILEE